MIVQRSAAARAACFITSYYHAMLRQPARIICCDTYSEGRFVIRCDVTRREVYVRPGDDLVSVAVDTDGLTPETFDVTPGIVLTQDVRGKIRAHIAAINDLESRT